MHKRTGKLIAVLLLSSSAVAANDRQARTDALFEQWSHPRTPGCSLGVIEDGRWVYRQGYGSANLEHDVTLSSRSVFRMASVSKQFAAFTTLLAEQRGQLSLDDDVRDYVPELPATDPPITIRHLIHHTSGIRDYLTVMYLGGVADDAAYTNEEVLRRLSKQQRTNFPAGSEYLYSNSGYFLLSQILPRATGRSLAELSRELVFEPLSMSETHFHDDLRRIVPGRATGYRPVSAGGYEIHATGLNMVGDGGLYTTVDDLLAWDRNFYTGEVGGESLRSARLATPRLSGGEPQIYAAGVQVSEYRGLRTISHGGSWVGFRTAMLMFPDQRWSTYVLCNVSSAQPTVVARAVADIYLEDALEPAPTPFESEGGAAAASQKAGTYWSDERRELIELTAERGGLEWKSAGLRFVRFEAQSWRGEDSGDGSAELRFAADDERPSFTLVQAGQRHFDYERARPWSPPFFEAAGLIGSYRSSELEVTYRVEPDDGEGLRLVTPTFESKLSPALEDVYRWDEGVIVIRRDPDGRVTGFELAASRARNFIFDEL